MSANHLEAFVRRTGSPLVAPAPPPPQNSEAIYHNRAYAQGLKLPRKKTSSANPFGQQLVSHTAQASSQSSNTNHGSRFTNGNIPQPQQAEHRPIGLPDSDIESNFDETLTSVTYGQSESENGQSYYGDHEYDHQGQVYQSQNYQGHHYQAEISSGEHYLQDQSQRDQSSSPTKARRPVPVTTSQYIAGHHRRQSDLPVPSNQNKGRISKKRGRTEESYQIQLKDIRADVDMVEHDRIGELLPAGTGLLRREGEEGEEDADEEGEEDGLEDNGLDLKPSDRGEATPTRHLEEDSEQSPEEAEYGDIKLPINPDSSTHSLDYSENELRRMEYSKLSTESWESDRAAFTLPETLQGATLDQQVDHYAHNKDKGHWANQVAFYQSLNSSQWDEAGDHLLAQIGNLFKQMKDAKKQKRKVLEEIEAEIEKREELVRDKSANIDAKFVAMQAGGEGLLKGKN